MIIDKILDRKDGVEYNAKEFYDYCSYSCCTGLGIAEALDSGENIDVQKELARYIIDNDYSVDIINYIYSVDWL